MTRRRPLWLVTDQLPYPPRNGVTVPLVHYAQGLARDFVVRLLFLEDRRFPPDPAQLQENEAMFGRICVIELARPGRMARIFRELSGRGMYRHAWAAAPAASAPEFRDALLIASPFSAVAKLLALLPASGWPFQRAIAAVNDSTTAEYRNRHHQSFGGPLSRVKAHLDWLRSFRLARAEASALERFDHVLVQTNADRDFLVSRVSAALAERITVAPNGVAPALFRLEPRTDSQSITFVAELSGEYRPVADWLLGEFWPRLLALCPAAGLRIVGGGADDALRARIRGAPNVTHLEYVPDLSAIYEGTAVALSPVYKGYGLINKTVEAMASGLPVVGPGGAFNGIDGFVADVHGIVCDSRDPARLAGRVADLLGDVRRRLLVGAAGRELVAKQFSWERTLARIARLLEPQAHHATSRTS